MARLIVPIVTFAALVHAAAWVCGKMAAATFLTSVGLVADIGGGVLLASEVVRSMGTLRAMREIDTAERVVEQHEWLTRVAIRVAQWGPSGAEEKIPDFRRDYGAVFWGALLLLLGFLFGSSIESVGHFGFG